MDFFVCDKGRQVQTLGKQPWAELPDREGYSSV